MRKGRLDSETAAGGLLLIAALILPLFISTYKAFTYSSFMFNIVLCMSITLIWGYCGTFSFGQAAFYGLGAYTYGAIAGNMESAAMTPVALIAAVVLVGLFATVIGYFMFFGGVNDVFVGIITLCLTFALNTFFGQTAGEQWKVGSVALGGYNGMSNIPTLQFGSYKLGSISMYYVGVFMVFAMIAALLLLKRSKVGYTIFAVRENRDRSSMFGYNVPLIQMLVFGVGGAIAALGGVMYASWGNYITPASMSVTQATIPVVLVASGGRTSPVAGCAFAFIYYLISNKLAATGSEYALVILGLLLINVILFIPKGLFKSLFDLADRKLIPVFARIGKKGEMIAHER